VSRRLIVGRTPYGSRIGTLAVGKAADLVLMDWEKIAYPYLDPETPMPRISGPGHRCRPIREDGGSGSSQAATGKVTYRQGSAEELPLPMAAPPHGKPDSSFVVVCRHHLQVRKRLSAGGDGFELSVPRVMAGDSGRRVPAEIAVFEVAGTAVALQRCTKVVGPGCHPEFR
jgi:hypothetical protein